MLERLWEETLQRAISLPEEDLHRSVDGEWSFVQTLAEVLAVRRQRQALVREVVASLDDARLATELTSGEPGWPLVETASVRQALRVVSTRSGSTASSPSATWPHSSWILLLATMVAVPCHILV